jgi:hypothetical protein
VLGALLVSGPLLFSSSLTAEPLSDLRTRLADLRGDQPVRMEMDVELKHRGSAPLHLNKEKKRGRAVVKYGSRGVEVIEQRWLDSSTRISVWRKGNTETEMPLLEETEAQDLADPAGMIDLLLQDATLVTDEAVTWQEQPARLLVIHPLAAKRGQDEAAAAPAQGDPLPYTLEAKIWLNDDGVPLAMERSGEIRLGGALSVTEHQTFTFQRVEGRLRAATSNETFSGTGLAVLHGRDDKKIKVTAVKNR